MPPCVTRLLHQFPARFTAAKLSRRSNAFAKGFHVSAGKSEKPTQKDILTALHRTNALLPKMLPPSKANSWSTLISTAGDILSGVTVRRPRVAVLGLDELAQHTELVTALLDDPLTSDKRTIDALRNRRAVHPNDVILVRHRDESHETHKTILSLNLPWLQKLDIEVLEIPVAHPDSTALLYDADVQILVASPLSAPLPRRFESFFLNPGSFLVLNYPTLDQRVTHRTVSRLASDSCALARTVKAKLLHVYAPRAILALDLFRQHPDSPNVVQAFQDDFLGSGVTALSQALSRELSLDAECRRSRYAQLVLMGALEACRDSMEAASRDAAVVQKRIEQLHLRIDSSTSTSVEDVLGGDEAPEVVDAVRRSTQEMQTALDALPWWKLPFKVDDLDEILTRTVERAWCRDLEAKLQFSTGRLSSLRSILTTETYMTFRHLPSSFQSATLLNELDQLSARGPDLAPDTLTYPLIYRLRQLQYPIVSLHQRAQTIVLAAVTTTFGCVGVAYAAWFLGWIAPQTAVGLGAFGTVAGLRWLIGSWEKRKKRWWEDWRRVGQGLARDLKDTIALVIQEKVTAVPRKAAAELSMSVAVQLSEIEAMKAELELERKLSQVVSGATSIPEIKGRYAP